MEPDIQEETAIPDYDAEIRITPREGILDPEGETIAGALERLGYEGVDGVRAGRLVHLRLAADDADAAREIVREMCEELIANPVTEDYAVRVEPAGEMDRPRGRDGRGAASGERGAGTA